MQFTDVGGGVIDSDYRDPVAVVCLSFSNRVFQIKKGQRFAQIIFRRLNVILAYLVLLVRNV